MSNGIPRALASEPDESFDPLAVPLRPAATVMLVRDHVVNGLEVFMLQRTLKAAFAKGMFVFPGGRVDDVDNADELEAICDFFTDAHASTLLGIPHGGLAYWIAAIRECFEEAGVLLARRADEQDALRFDDADVEARFVDLRRAVNDGRTGFIDMCLEENLRLTTDTIHYVSHWITPLGEVRRFDTRFFIAPAPPAQAPLHDDRETIDSLWVSPREALDRFERGELAMIPPTTSNLEFLLPHWTTEEALAAARRVGTPVTVLPKLRTDADGRVVGVIMPGDPDYDEQR
jgi:8-oxo-dGTP pyrophosphatase MutT (NUDIX family)